MTKSKENNQVAIIEAGKSVSLQINKMQDEFARVLSSGVNASRFTRIAISTVKTNPKLLEADRASLLASIMTAAQVNLEVDPAIGHVALVPFYNWKTQKNEVQMQVMYKGLIELIMRSGRVKKIYARCFYENEVKQGNFQIVLGTDEKIIHNPMLIGDLGEVAGAYAVAVMETGEIAFDFMTRSQILKIRDRKKGKDGKPMVNPVWVSDEEEMFKKTVVKRLSKMLPKCFELKDEHLVKALAVDNAAENGNGATINNDGDVIIDNETGEITEPENKTLQDITPSLPPKKEVKKQPDIKEATIENPVSETILPSDENNFYPDDF